MPGGRLRVQIEGVGNAVTVITYLHHLLVESLAGIPAGSGDVFAQIPTVRIVRVAGTGVESLSSLGSVRLWALTQERVAPIRLSGAARQAVIASMIGKPSLGRDSQGAAHQLHAVRGSRTTAFRRDDGPATELPIPDRTKRILRAQNVVYLC